MNKALQNYQRALKKQINEEMARAEMAQEAEERGYRKVHALTLVQQIGKMNILAISGGRVEVRETGITLPVAKGYSVAIDLNFMDLYDVKRVYTRAGERKVKGEVTDVYFSEVGEIAYKASCFVNVKFGEKEGVKK